MIPRCGTDGNSDQTDYDEGLYGNWRNCVLDPAEVLEFLAVINIYPVAFYTSHILMFACKLKFCIVMVEFRGRH